MRHTTEMLRISSILEKGYIPLACNDYAAIAIEGEYLKDFWMWNRQFNELACGSRRIQTVRVTELKQAAIRYWRDGWVPLKPIDEKFLRRMETALREHRGLKMQGFHFPDASFLEQTPAIEEAHLGPELRKYLGLGPKKSAEASDAEVV